MYVLTIHLSHLSNELFHASKNAFTSVTPISLLNKEETTPKYFRNALPERDVSIRGTNVAVLADQTAFQRRSLVSWRSPLHADGPLRPGAARTTKPAPSADLS